MLSFLLDEQISPEIAKQITQKHPEITIYALQNWQDGIYLGMSDETILQAAARDNLTLVTYDLKTIPSILVAWGEQKVEHSGVIFIDYRSISPSNFGGLVKALIWLWQTQNQRNWHNRIVYLQPN